MIEVRSSYLVKMKDRTQATALWRQARDTIWPILNWQGVFSKCYMGMLSKVCLYGLRSGKTWRLGRQVWPALFIVRNTKIGPKR